jgi:hypothetical protein
MSLLAYVVGCLTPFALILAWAAIIDWRDNANAKRANANWREAQRLGAEVERLRELVSERVDECECADCVDEQIWEPGGGSHSTAPVPVCWSCRARAALPKEDDR